jgi:ribosomal protein L19E
MKPLPIILVALLAGAAGAASGWIASRCSQCSAPVTNEALQADIKPQAALQPKTTTREAELATKVENLERALDAIHQDVSELRAGSSRTAAVEPEKAPIDQDAIAFAAAHKSAIKAVIEEDRVEQARKAEEERKQRSIDQAQQQADRVAQKVGLNAAQTKQLEAFAETSRQRMDELRASMQNGTGDPQSMRQSFQEFREWSQTELTTLYGGELAGKIMEEGIGMGMGRGGPGGWAGGPGGGQGGNAATGGGGQRRGRNGGGGQPGAGGAGAPGGQTGGGGG